MVVLEDPSDGRSHQRFPEPHNIAYQDSLTLVEVVSRDFHRRFLKLEQGVAEIARNAEF